MTSDTATLAERLDAYRATHPVRTVDHGGHTWRYRVGGEGETLLMLGGAVGVSELGFEVAQLLEPHLRMIAMDYPACGTMDGLVAGAAAVLDAEGVSSAHVSGGSYGGMIAQRLVRAHPERVRSLVLSHTAAPDPKIKGAPMWLLRLLPLRILRAGIMKKLRPTYESAGAFWAGLLDSAIAALPKDAVLARVAAAADFLATPLPPLAGWPGRVLVIDADDDTLVSRRVRDGVLALHPRAATYTFRGTGHAAAILRPRQYADVLRRFALGEPLDDGWSASVST